MAVVAVLACLHAGLPAAGTVAPAWLGTRVLPSTADGFGEVRPTPAALRDRRFTLPDALPELPGTGFASRVEPGAGAGARPVHLAAGLPGRRA